MSRVHRLVLTYCIAALEAKCQQQKKRIKVTYTLSINSGMHAGSKGDNIRCKMFHRHTHKFYTEYWSLQISKHLLREDCTVNDFCSRNPVVGDAVTVLWYKVPAVIQLPECDSQWKESSYRLYKPQAVPLNFTPTIVQ